MFGNRFNKIVVRIAFLHTQFRVHGTLEELGLMEKPKIEANETNASTMKAAGSAWACVGDTV